MTSLPRTIDLLRQLVAFDTTSRLSNLDLIAWVEATLAPLGARLHRMPDPTGAKANLWVRIGPDAPGGLILSGHTDVVPVDGQPWTSDPFALTERDGRLYGRGAADMKGFIALCLAFAPAFAAAGLRRPVDLALSFDEEVGCRGVLPMIARIAAETAARPSIAWVGEPTLWGAVTAHKGIRDYEVRLTGREAHSSDPRKGASAIHEAIGLMALLRGIAGRLEQEGPFAPEFEPPFATLTIGEVGGGTAMNILARECRFVFDLRCTPEVDADAALEPFHEAVAQTHARLSAWGPECGVSVTLRGHAPPLRREADGAAERLVRDLTGDNSLRVASYAAEAGQFQTHGFSTVICGPGSIDQAHQPDEFIAVSELARGVDIFGALVRRLGG